jgi:hypothetical protein
MVIVRGKQKNLNRINSMLVPSPLVSGPTVNKLLSSSNGSASAVQAVPKRTYRTVRAEINSIDRDFAKYPYSSEFSWEFPFPVKEIKEVRVIGGTIPVPYLNIDTPWNQFTFCEGSTYYDITIPIGYYTITSIISKLNTLLNNLGANYIYTVLQTSTGQLQITSSGSDTFYFLFATGTYKDTIDSGTNSILNIRSPAKLLGFGFGDFASSNQTIIAPFIPNLWYCLERSYLYMNFDSNQDLRSIFRGSGRKEPSAIIYNDNLDNAPATKYLNKETFDTNIVPTPASLSRIRSIEISLRDMFYNNINMQGREVSLLLELVIGD